MAFPSSWKPQIKTSIAYFKFHSKTPLSSNTLRRITAEWLWPPQTRVKVASKQTILLLLKSSIEFQSRPRHSFHYHRDRPLVHPRALLISKIRDVARKRGVQWIYSISPLISNYLPNPQTDRISIGLSFWKAEYKSEIHYGPFNDITHAYRIFSPFWPPPSPPFLASYPSSSSALDCVV